MNKLKQLLKSPRLLVWLGVFVFGYSWFASLCLQLWIIPSLFSQPGAAEGLVVLDSIGFNRIAKEQAAEITRLGWSAWELRPQGQSPAGIASLFYALFGPSPASALPFNAAVHAASACVVMVILRNFFAALPATLGALAFVLNPASFEWIAQIHRDGVFILGNLLFILGIMGFFCHPGDRGGQWLRYLLAAATMPALGTMLVWVARPYWVQVMLGKMLLVLLALVFANLFRRAAGGRRHIASLVAAFVIVVAFQLSLVGFHTPTEPVYLPEPVQTPLPHAGEIGWQRSAWLPKMVEERFYRIASARQGAITQRGNTLVDAEWRLDSAGAMVGYVPRALQLGLFSPLPKLWGGEASTPAMTMARKVMGGATLFFYACLLGFAIGLGRMRRNMLLWVMTGVCLLGILGYAISYPNIGTLMRYR